MFNWDIEHWDNEELYNYSEYHSQVLHETVDIYYFNLFYSLHTLFGNINQVEIDVPEWNRILLLVKEMEPKIHMLAAEYQIIYNDIVYVFKYLQKVSPKRILVEFSHVVLLKILLLLIPKPA